MRKSRVRTAFYVLVFVVVALAAVDIGFRSEGETAAERAHRICTDCGLSESEIDEMIRNKRESSLTREQEIRAFLATYSDPAELTRERELCQPCVIAVLDAAGK